MRCVYFDDAEVEAIVAEALELPATLDMEDGEPGGYLPLTVALEELGLVEHGDLTDAAEAGIRNFLTENKSSVRRRLLEEYPQDGYST